MPASTLYQSVKVTGGDVLCVHTFLIAGEKRKTSEPLHHEENKRPRVVGDIPMDLINEVMATIADPATIPEVTALSLCSF